MTSRDRERGAAAVEAVLVTPIFVLLVLGIIEFALFFQNNLSASDAVKAGVRMASAEGRNANFAQDAADRVATAGGAMHKSNIEELWVYRANPADEFPLGFSSFDSCTVCVKFHWTGSTFEPTYVGWSSTSQHACAAGTLDRVGVYLQLRHDALTSMVFTTVTIREANVLGFEPIPASNGCGP
jgi:Flp pilus assembly protein TadG